MRFFMYRDVHGFWRWHLCAANGRKIADSGEGYHNRMDCRHAIELVMGAGGVPVVEGE
jgi:uncharacterized protein YegP (UPF0339 family)